MVVVAGNGDEAVERPVLKEWLKLERVVARAAKGNISLVRSDSITRDTVADNHELLGTLVSHYGILSANYEIENTTIYVGQFFKNTHAY